jgi:hypothetical protein
MDPIVTIAEGLRTYASLLNMLADFLDPEWQAARELAE